MAEATSDQSMKTVAGGSTAEAVGGIAAIVLTIIGLAHIMPYAMASISTIVVGAALLLEGGAVAARLADLTRAEGAAFRTELGGGVSAEVLGGIAGIVLGISALIGFAPLVLVPVANIVFGAALIVGAAVTASVDRTLPTTTHGEYVSRARATHQLVSAASGTQILVGIAAIVLGILALFGIAPLMLSLVALLVVGASVLLSGSAVGGRVMSFLSR